MTYTPVIRKLYFHEIDTQQIGEAKIQPFHIDSINMGKVIARNCEILKTGS